MRESPTEFSCLEDSLFCIFWFQWKQFFNMIPKICVCFVPCRVWCFFHTLVSYSKHSILSPPSTFNAFRSFNFFTKNSYGGLCSWLKYRMFSIRLAIPLKEVSKYVCFIIGVLHSSAWECQIFSTLATLHTIKEELQWEIWALCEISCHISMSGVSDDKFSNPSCSDKLRNNAPLQTSPVERYWICPNKYLF